MAKNEIYKFRDIDEATFFLNGGIKGAKSLRQASSDTRTNLIPAIYGLVGKTLKFLQPAAHEITFTAGSAVDDPNSLTFADIKSQIEAAFGTALIVRSFDAFIGFIESTPANGVQITASTDPTKDSRSLLGLTIGQDTIGKLYKPVAISPTPPCWIWADTNNENMHVVYTWE